MENLIKNIVKNAEILKDKYTDQKNVAVNYACVFCQSEKEQNDFLKETHKLGTIIKETPSGPLFKISPIETVAGQLQPLDEQLGL